MLTDIKAFLQSKSLINIYIGNTPTNECIGLYETTGLSPIISFDKTIGEYRGLQVLCKGIDYSDVEKRANDIYKLLAKDNNLNMHIRPEQSPFSLGMNDQKIWTFSCNYIVIKEG